MNVSLRVNDAGSFVKLLVELKKAGLLKSMPDEVEIDEDDFPMDIPLDVTKLLEMVGNPVVRKIFGKKMDATLTEHIAQMIGAQA